MSVTTEGYEIRLSQFEGSLDLMLHLVRRSEIDLKDIFVSDITDQYMRYMKQVGEVDLNQACDFLETASQLLFIKSRLLLPSNSTAQEPEEDPAEALLENLRVYEIYKKASDKLRAKEIDGSRMFSRKCDEVPLQVKVRAAPKNVQILVDAVSRIRRRRNGSAPVVMKIASETWSIEQQKTWIKMKLHDALEPITFDSLFDDSAVPQKVVVTFAAMLELWNQNMIRVAQKAAFADILISETVHGESGREAG